MLGTARAAIFLLRGGWKRFFAVTVLIALLSLTAGLLGASLLSGGGLEPLEIGIVDLDRSRESRLILSAVSAYTGDFLALKRMTQQGAEEGLSSGGLSAAFILPEGFLSSVLSGENKPLRAIYNPAMPLRASLSKLLADTLLGLLRASQSGIYAGLAHAREHAPEQYQTVLDRVNMRFLGLSMRLDSIYTKERLSATGEIPPAAHYAAHALIFFYTLCAAMLFPMIRGGFSRVALSRLRACGRPSASTSMGWILALWFWNTLAAAVTAGLYFLLSRMIPLPFDRAILYVIPILTLCLSAFSAATAFLFERPLSAAVFVCFFSAASLFLSGGLIPLSMLPDFFAPIARLLPSYSAARLLGGSLYGFFYSDAPAFVLCSVLGSAFACTLCVSHKGKAVKAF